MIFYTATDADGRTHWEKTQADARAINKNFEQVDVPVDKPGLHVWLNAMQQKLDEERSETFEHGFDAGAQRVINSQPEPDPSYTNWSVKLDEEWDKLPLAHQLHFAAMAMERARSLVSEPIEAEPEPVTG
jgi:hypothetical protein